MKKISAVVLILAGLFILSTSCNKTPTYADRLKTESKAIDRFISKNKFVILKEFPESGVFKTNEFYKDPGSGVYYNIINKGEADDKITLGEEIYIRFSGLSYFMTEDTLTYSNLDPNRSPFPETLVFRGPVNMSTRSLYDGSTPGWIVPIGHIGHSAVVKMIVPFNMGSSYDRSKYQPTYYEHVEYRFESK